MLQHTSFFNILKPDSNSFLLTRQKKQNPQRTRVLTTTVPPIFFLQLSIGEGTISLTSYFCKVAHHQVDHLLPRLITPLISFPCICLMYFMAFCISFARVEFPFSEGPLSTQPRCIILSSGFPSVLSPPPRHTYPFQDRTLLKLLWPKFIQVSLVPQSNYWWHTSVRRGRRAGIKSFLHRFSGVVWA